MRFEEIKAALADTWPVDTVLDSARSIPGPASSRPYAAHIAAASAPTVEEIVARLSGMDGKARDWAEGVIADLRSRSPISLKVTHRHIRDARALDLRQTLSVDYRLACRFLDGHDFYEGVRAALIDKDGKPQLAAGPAARRSRRDGRRLFRAYGSDELGAADTRRNAGSARVVSSGQA